MSEGTVPYAMGLHEGGQVLGGCCLRGIVQDGTVPVLAPTLLRAQLEVSDIIKTWPAFMARKRVLEVFTHEWGRFYFTLGRGKPSQMINNLFFTHRGRILGHFQVGEVVQNAGQLPKLRSISGELSEWQIKPDRWVAICPPPFHKLGERLFFEPFRGWRYFDLSAHRGLLESKVRL
jgi:hypothetical protein